MEYKFAHFPENSRGCNGKVLGRSTHSTTIVVLNITQVVLNISSTQYIVYVSVSPNIINISLQHVNFILSITHFALNISCPLKIVLQFSIQIAKQFPYLEKRIPIVRFPQE